MVVAIMSCHVDEKPYSIYWQEESLYVVMPHPSKGIIGTNLEDWHGVILNEVVNSIFCELKENSHSERTDVLIRFEEILTDKYGNKSTAYNDFKIAEVYQEEARKYRGSQFFDSNYHISDNIRKAAFDNIEIQPVKDLTTDTVRSVNVTTQQLEQAQEEWEEWIKQRNSEEVP